MDLDARLRRVEVVLLAVSIALSAAEIAIRLCSG
jgi:hypothetical protein